MANVSVTVENDTIVAQVAGFGDDSIPAVDWKAAAAALPQATRDRLLRIGLTNVLRDCQAGKVQDGSPADLAQAVVDCIKRLESGEVTGGSRGPRLSDEERHRRDFITEKLRDAARAAGVKMLTGKELTAKIDSVYAANKEAVDREITRRMKAKSVEFDVAI